MILSREELDSIRKSYKALNQSDRNTASFLYCAMSHFIMREGLVADWEEYFNGIDYSMSADLFSENVPDYLKGSNYDVE